MIAYLYAESELSDLVSLVKSRFADACVYVLTGDLGAGKTSFVKSFCKSLDINDDVTSPTFSLVNEYQLQSNESVFHMDLYRIEDSEELIDIGFEDYLTSGRFIFIEWADIALPFLDDYIEIQIEQLSDSTRKFIINQR